MTFLVQHIRSGEYARRPQPLDLAPGQIAVNYNSDSTGLYFRTDNGELVKAGPAHVGPTAPPQINWTNSSIGELWLDTTNATSPAMRVYTGTGWVQVSAPYESITTDKIANGAVTSVKLSLDDNVEPTENDAVSLGSETNRFSSIYARDIFTGDLHLKNEKGDWTMIEAEDCLTLRNNKTGKRFKIVMEALD